MKTLCKVCGSHITECHCIEPGALHRRNPLPSKEKSKVNNIQPEICLNCKHVWGADCEFTEDGKAETNSKDFWCSEYNAFKTINGKNLSKVDFKMSYLPGKEKR